MKIAIFHDYFSLIGGGERLVLTLAHYLHADVYTTDCDQRVLSNMGFDSVSVHSLGKTLKIPGLRQIHATLLFRFCHVPQYDLYIFSGNWARYAAKNRIPNIWYCHTPVRAFYDLYGYYLTFLSRSIFKKFLFRIWTTFHRWYDKRTISWITCIIANSKNTSKRISLYLGRNSQVIYPPISLSLPGSSSEGIFWLSVNRLYPEKRIELQINAFRLVPEEKLLIIGDRGKGDHSSGYLTSLGEIPHNVTIMGSITDHDLLSLYQECKGVICTAQDEDFGMVPLEAMANGKPVIAVAEGGFLETVIDRETGRLVSADAKSIAEAIRDLSKEEIGFYSDACRVRAEEFSVDEFISQMKGCIDCVMKNNHDEEPRSGLFCRDSDEFLNYNNG